MARPHKYDYDALYQEFFESNHIFPLSFLREKGIVGKNQNLRSLSDSIRKRFWEWAGRKRYELSVDSVYSRRKRGRSPQEEKQTLGEITAQINISAETPVTLEGTSNLWLKLRQAQDPMFHEMIIDEIIRERLSGY